MNTTLNRYIPMLLLGVALASSCGGAIKSGSEEQVEQQSATSADTAGTERTISFTKQQYQLSAIQTGTITSRNLSSIIKLTGTIAAEPSNIASVSAPLGGYIKTAGMLEGQYVKKGQLLATLENRQFISMQQEYLESVGQLDFLEEEYKRQQTLRSEDINSQKTLQQVRSDYNVAKARISGLEQQMALIGINVQNLRKSNTISRTANLYAPISGYIRSSNVNLGKYVAPTDVLFDIVGTDRLHLSFKAFEKDLGTIKVGQDVRFSLSSENLYDRSAKVFLVGQASDEQKMVPVLARLSQSTGLLPGMYVKGWIETGKQQTPAVPSDAIVQLEGLDYVIQQTGSSDEGYSFKLLRVARGVEQEGYTAIDLADQTDVDKLVIVVKNSYTILSAIKNAEEEE